MAGFRVNSPLYDFGGYLDTDLGDKVKTFSRLSILPSAWNWSNPIARLPNETQSDYYRRGQAGAELKAKNLGYQLLQRSSFSLDGKYPVDPLFCINPFQAWGNPLIEEEPMTPYVFQLANGGLGIRYEAGSRSINGGELEGPLHGEIVHLIPANSTWEYWVLQELAKYERELNPTPVGGQYSHLTLDIPSIPGVAIGEFS